MSSNTPLDSEIQEVFTQAYAAHRAFVQTPEHQARVDLYSRNQEFQHQVQMSRKPEQTISSAFKALDFADNLVIRNYDTCSAAHIEAIWEDRRFAYKRLHGMTLPFAELATLQLGRMVWHDIFDAAHKKACGGDKTIAVFEPINLIVTLAKSKAEKVSNLRITRRKAIKFLRSKCIIVDGLTQEERRQLHSMLSQDSLH